MADRSRNQLLITLLRFVAELAHREWQIDEIAAELGISRRTAYRYLASMEGAGLSARRTRFGQQVLLGLDGVEVLRWLDLAPAKRSGPARKLSDSQIAELRAMRKPVAPGTMEMLAAHWGVSVSTLQTYRYRRDRW